VSNTTISTTVGELTYTEGFRTRKKSYVESATLLKTLQVIRDSAKEEHTKRNLQTLMDQIIKMGPTL
jgi:hypothetical protein